MSFCTPSRLNKIPCDEKDPQPQRQKVKGIDSFFHFYFGTSKMLLQNCSPTCKNYGLNQIWGAWTTNNRLNVLIFLLNIRPIPSDKTGWILPPRFWDWVEIQVEKYRKNTFDS